MFRYLVFLLILTILINQIEWIFFFWCHQIDLNNLFLLFCFTVDAHVACCATLFGKASKWIKSFGVNKNRMYFISPFFFKVLSFCKIRIVNYEFSMYSLHFEALFFLLQIFTFFTKQILKFIFLKVFIWILDPCLDFYIEKGVGVDIWHFFTNWRGTIRLLLVSRHYFGFV